MIAEPILAFFLTRHLRKILQKSSVRPEWDKPLQLAMFAILGAFIIQVVFSLETVTIWIWHAVMLLLIAVIFKMSEFHRARNIMTAFLPLVVVFVLKDIIKLLPDRVNETYGGYLNFAVPFSVIWMIVMLIIFNKQSKALEKEHKKARENEEQKQIIAARKTELEVMVAERTFEIMQQKNELEHALVELQTTQAQLIQSEKMASLGALTAGIAHEIQNPLNFVNNFSEVNNELISEMVDEINRGNKEEVKAIAQDVQQNLEKIIHHGKRADAIVKGMLQHSRVSTGQKEPTDINALCDEYLRLSYHGLRARDKNFNADFKKDFDESIAKINIAPQDIGRVLLNLFNNAFYAVSEKQKAESLKQEKYKPLVTVQTKKINDNIEIIVSDNGNGIAQNIIDKIFQPFFTTKPTGQGTGLGLSLSYDIIKAHGGEIKVETKEARPDDPVGRGEGSEFIVQLPI